jgi:hypothetical protein
MATNAVSAGALKALIAETPQAAGAAIDRLWRDDAAICGSMCELVDSEPQVRLDLLLTMRVVALSTDCDPEVVAQLVEDATTRRSGDVTALHSAAAFALVKPATMRWVTANARRVAASPNWLAVLPGLAGATVSVPLAEEALSTVIAAGGLFPAEITDYVQLNPWFSGGFAVRLRRHQKGKRLRIRERGATTRAWSHGRTALGSRLPARWRSLQGRGVGRPLDQWSCRFLTDYAELISETYRPGGVPPVIAPLYTVTFAVEGIPTPTAASVAEWDSLPGDMQQMARRVIGLDEANDRHNSTAPHDPTVAVVPPAGPRLPFLRRK